jgi:hypothetical protein
MELFASFMEIIAPSPAPKDSIINPVIEVGAEISLSSIDGQIFNCFILVPMKLAASTLVRCKYILALTDTQIIELYPHATKSGVATAAEVHDLQALVKLKFKKGEQGILLLQYQNGKISKILIDDPAVCVGHIKTKMRNMGINGSIKNRNTKMLENAQAFFTQARSIETEFSLSPSVEYIQEMMDLLRRAAEKFGEANDDKYLEVMDFIKRFLQRADVGRILDASVPGTMNTAKKMQREAAAAAALAEQEQEGDAGGRLGGLGSPSEADYKLAPETPSDMPPRNTGKGLGLFASPDPQMLLSPGYEDSDLFSANKQKGGGTSASASSSSAATPFAVTPSAADGSGARDRDMDMDYGFFTPMAVIGGGGATTAGKATARAAAVGADTQEGEEEGVGEAASSLAQQLHTPQAQQQQQLPMPDTDGALRALNNAMIYDGGDFEEDGGDIHHYYHLSPPLSVSVGSPGAGAGRGAQEHPELAGLNSLLDTMTMELDTLLTSFNEPVDPANQPKEADGTSSSNLASSGNEAFIDLDFQEVDFESTFDEVQKILQS